MFSEHAGCADTAGYDAGQRVITGKLESLAQLSEQLDNNIPTLIIIGEVVSLRERLSWFGR